MDTAAAITKIASRQGLLSKEGALKELDSLGVIDLIVAIENTFSIAIPPEEIEQEHFSSLSSLATFVDRLRKSTST